MPHYGHMLRLLHCSISQAMNNALASMELTSSQGHIMGYLAHCKEPPCPRDIEEQFQLSHPTVSGLLSRLEKKDFIRLQPDPVDHRCKRVYIQPKGMSCLETMHGVISGIEAQLVTDFSEAEKQQFHDFLIRATRNMGADLCHHNSKEESEK